MSVRSIAPKFLTVAVALGLTLLAAGPAAACGGLFCNTAQPVNQAAERILFAWDGEVLQMHVRITYAGPPTEFGWLLPAPAGVETALSSEELFQQLDRSYGPRFVVQTVFDDDCAMDFAMDGGAAEGEGEGGGGDRGVQVLSREAVGPFDRAILAADDVGVLREWLDENGYQIPDATDSKLEPYLAAGQVFVALKLLPGTDSGDIQPLRLSFLSDTAAIPITPTAVAADPDMGVIVHVLGDSRAIPVNYLHVQINEAAIDWFGGGQNYPDVVSQAADEAGGHAFATDYAGDLDALTQGLAPIPPELMESLAGAETLADVAQLFAGWSDADVMRVFDSMLPLPDGVNAASYMGCPGCFDEGEQAGMAAVDAAALVDRLQEEVVVPREEIVTLVGRKRYLTRLYTTLSAAEMDVDPEFSFNADLEDVAAVRTAINRIPCNAAGNDVDFDKAVLETPSGLRFATQGAAVPQPIRRAEGRTVAGGEAFGAAVIERIGLTGAPEVQENRRAAIQAPIEPPPAAGAGAGSGGARSDQGGCACGVVAGGSASGAPLLLLLGLLLAWRRRV